MHMPNCVHPMKNYAWSVNDTNVNVIVSIAEGIYQNYALCRNYNIVLCFHAFILRYFARHHFNHSSFLASLSLVFLKH